MRRLQAYQPWFHTGGLEYVYRPAKYTWCQSLTFQFHQCRYGYRDIFEVAAVVHNYSEARIPLETMWTDIDYMDHRKVFTLDRERFPLDTVRALVQYLHQRDQHYIVMVDPAVAYSENGAFTRGLERDVFMRKQDGSLYQGTCSA